MSAGKYSKPYLLTHVKIYTAEQKGAVQNWDTIDEFLIEIGCQALNSKKINRIFIKKVIFPKW